MATGVRKTTPFGTFPELSLDYLESVERVVTNFLCTWYHAFPAWRRPKHCTQNLSDLQAHLEKFYEHEYHFNETQILLAAIKRWGQQRHSDAILDWLHAEFLLRVQEAARHYSTASSEVALLSEKITRLMEELEKSTLAPSYDYNSRAKHDAPVIIQTFPDDGLDTPMYRVREPAQEVQDRNEQKFYQLYTVATEHAAKIDVLEQKVSILLSNASTPSVKASIPVRAEKEQEPSGGLGESSEASTVNIPTPTSTIRSNSPLQTPEQHWPTVILCVKGHNTNMLVKLGCDTSLGSLRWTIRSPDSDSIELWHGNTQIKDNDTPNSLGLEENSLINIVVPLHRSDWIDESKTHFRNTFAV